MLVYTTDAHFFRNTRYVVIGVLLTALLLIGPALDAVAMKHQAEEHLGMNVTHI